MNSGPSELDAQQAARMAATMSDEDIERALSDPAVRARALDAIFDRMCAHYQSEHGGSDALVQWEITTPDAEPDTYRLRLSTDRCEVDSESEDDPDLRLRLDLVGFVRLVTGRVDGMTLFMSERLSFKGDQWLALRLSTLFEVPRP